MRTLTKTDIKKYLKADLIKLKKTKKEITMTDVMEVCFSNGITTEDLKNIKEPLIKILEEVEIA